MPELTDTEVQNLAIFRNWLLGKLSYIPIDKRLEYLQSFKDTLDKEGFDKAVERAKLWINNGDRANGQ